MQRCSTNSFHLFTLRTVAAAKLSPLRCLHQGLDEASLARLASSGLEAGLKADFVPIFQWISSFDLVRGKRMQALYIYVKMGNSVIKNNCVTLEKTICSHFSSLPDSVPFRGRR